MVVDFDADGVLDPTSIDDAVSGTYASTNAIVTEVGGTIDADVVELRDALNTVIDETFGNVVGYSNVFLDGQRSEVRTEETNLGSLSADANLWMANILDDVEDVQISLKNGGGIRAEIGQRIVDGVDTFFEAPLDNEVSEGSLNGVFRFNNGLTRLTVTATELKDIMENGVSQVAPGVTDGRFPQLGGVRIEYDPNGTGRTDVGTGDRIQTIIVYGGFGAELSEPDTVVFEGAIVGDANRTFNMVTLDFLAGGQDGYPFDVLSAPNRLDYEVSGTLANDPGNQSFTDTGSEQDAIAEYFEVFHSTPEEAYNQYETPLAYDARVIDITAEVPVEEDLDTFTDIVTMTPVSTFAVPGEVFDESAAEIPAYDAEREQVFFTDANSEVIHVLDLSKIGNPTLVQSIELGGAPNSVAVYGDLVAVAVEADTKTDNGSVEFYSAVDYSLLHTVEVGALPDMVTFNEDGTLVLVANEGEPSDNYQTDPDGSVSVISLNASDITASTVATATFTSFNGNVPNGVRIFGRSANGAGDAADDFATTAAQDLEPEYITVSGDLAYVTCQENNTLAIVDISTPGTPVVTDLLPLGTVNHLVEGNGFDPSDRDDAISIAQVPVRGYFMPDAIASYTVGDDTYLVTANEGDAREYEYEDGAGEDVLAFAEEERIKDLDLDLGVFPASIQEDELLGRLTVTTIEGDIDDDGEFEELYSFGTRSFTIWDAATGEVVWDSKNQLEQLIKQRIPDNFNGTNDENDFDSRSDAKGPEPEGVTLGAIDGTWYAFVGLERIGGIAVYDITDPENPTFASYINNRDFSVEFDEDSDPEIQASAGDLGPEGLAFVAAEDSPNGENLLIVTNEVSGTVTTYQIGGTINAAPTITSAIDDRTEIETFGSFTVDLGTVFTDTDALTYEVESSDVSVATVAESGGTLTVTEAGIGTTTISVKALDTDGFNVTDEFDLTVEANTAPASSGLSDRTEDTGFGTFTINLSTVFTDANGDDLTFSATSGTSTVATVAVSGSTLTVTEVGEGTSLITVTANDGITSTDDSFTLTIEEILGFDDVQGLSIYPVPIKSVMTIEHQGMNISHVNVYSLGGQLMKSSKLAANKLDISDLNAGIYVLELVDAASDKPIKVKIVKQ